MTHILWLLAGINFGQALQMLPSLNVEKLILGVFLMGLGCFGGDK